MESIWKPKTKYYIKLNLGQLKQVLGEMLEGIVKYKPRKDGLPWTLEKAMRHAKYITGNKVIISIQITNTGYVEYTITNGEIINTEYVLDFIDSEDFDLAKYFFEVDEFMTKAEYDLEESIES